MSIFNDPGFEAVELKNIDSVKHNVFGVKILNDNNTKQHKKYICET